MKKTDINKYNTTTGPFAQEGEQSRSAAATARGIVRAVLRLLVTFLVILGIAGTAAGVTVINFVLDEGNKVEAPRLDLQKLDYNSVIYVQNQDGEFEEYLSLHSSENRVWVDYVNIPKYMKDAIVAIEDKRFYEHHGVDWKTTFGAVGKLFTGGSGGGSTITQQLIKNQMLTSERSYKRKIQEFAFAYVHKK